MPDLIVSNQVQISVMMVISSLCTGLLLWQRSRYCNYVKFVSHSLNLVLFAGLGLLQLEGLNLLILPMLILAKGYHLKFFFRNHSWLVLGSSLATVFVMICVAFKLGRAELDTLPTLGTIVLVWLLSDPSQISRILNRLTKSRYQLAK